MLDSCGNSVAHLTPARSLTNLLLSYYSLTYSLLCIGNSVAHVAALRGAARCLRLAFGLGGVAAGTRNAAGWTALQEAYPTYHGCLTKS